MPFVRSMLRAMQRVKSEGDFAVGKALVESNGVKVDRDLYREVLQQVEPFGLAPGSGFVDPMPEPVTDSKGETTGIRSTCPRISLTGCCTAASASVR